MLSYQKLRIDNSFKLRNSPILVAAVLENTSPLEYSYVCVSTLESGLGIKENKRQTER